MLMPIIVIIMDTFDISNKYPLIVKYKSTNLLLIDRYQSQQYYLSGFIQYSSITKKT